MTFLRRAALLRGAALFAVTCPGGPALAQGTSPAETAATQEGSAEAIIVTGNRFGGRSATQSATPVDAIGREALQQAGRVDLIQQLKVQVPSFNAPRPLGSGVGDYLTPPSLRGLGPGEVLVLVNGKRRHTTADLNTSNGIGRGDVAVDFNALPSFAMARVEVLRDGASAQYGSDAISGVINFILDDTIGTRAQATYGTTIDGDEEFWEGSVSSGFALGENGGVLRLTASVQDREGTDRSRPDTRQQYFGTNPAGRPVAPSTNFGSGIGLTPANGTLDPREATIGRDTFLFGDQPSTNRQLFYNLVAPTAADDVQLYSFGGYSRLDGDIEYFFRRAGQNETLRALYPNGYRPQLDSQIDNISLAVGLRGDDLAGFGWDLSTVYGNNGQRLFYANSANVSLGNDTPTRFKRLEAEFTQWTSNLDLTRALELGDGTPLNVALGAEYRREGYRLLPGDIDGFRDGGVPILDGPAAGQQAPIGAQPGPSGGPGDRADLSRSSWAIYAELEKELFDRLLLQGAVRHEDYSDFGDTTNWKVAGRLELFGGLAARASYNTAFRAPALAQRGYNASNTLILNGQQAIVRVAAVDSPAARLAGASALTPERSRNLSAGLTFADGPLTATLDAYRIRVRDRIAISSTFQDARLTAFLAANAQGNFSAISYLTNAVDTTTDGIDLVVNYRHTFGDGSTLRATLAGNYNATEFNRIAATPAALAALGLTTQLFDLTQQLRFSDSLPRDKIVLDLGYTRGDVSLSLTNTRYGEVSSVQLTNQASGRVAALIEGRGYDVDLVPVGAAGNADIVQTFGARLLTDLELAWQATPLLRLSAGAQNLFDVYPEENIASRVVDGAGVNGADNAGTQPYNAVSPFGFNGRSVFVRVGLAF